MYYDNTKHVILILGKNSIKLRLGGGGEYQAELEEQGEGHLAQYAAL